MYRRSLEKDRTHAKAPWVAPAGCDFERDRNFEQPSDRAVAV